MRTEATSLSVYSCNVTCYPRKIRTFTIQAVPTDEATGKSVYELCANSQVSFLTRIYKFDAIKFYRYINVIK